MISLFIFYLGCIDTSPLCNKLHMSSCYNSTILAACPCGCKAFETGIPGKEKCNFIYNLRVTFSRFECHYTRVNSSERKFENLCDVEALRHVAPIPCPFST